MMYVSLIQSAIGRVPQNLAFDRVDDGSLEYQFAVLELPYSAAL